MSSLFKPSRLVALALVVGTVLWFLSGYLGGGHGATDDHAAAPVTTAEGAAAPATEGHTETAAAAASDAAPVPIQKVAVEMATPEMHSQTVVLSCVTEADKRASAVARGAGVLIDLRVSRGDKVRAGEVVALISDEGRAASLGQAQALLDQTLIEYDARKVLVDRGDAPKNTLAALEAAVAAARAAVAAAEAEADRSNVRAPIDGVIDTVPFQVGQAVAIGSEIAAVIDPDPMLAVGQVSEARRNSLVVGQAATIRFIDSSSVTGTVDFVGLSADKATRTYPVEASINNAEATIADGVTCEMSVALEPVEAAPITRSALVFSDEGHLGVRIVDSEGKAQFMPIDIVDDTRDVVWVTGIAEPTRVIVVGQDFVREGDTVEAVSAADASSNEAPPA